MEILLPLILAALVIYGLYYLFSRRGCPRCGKRIKRGLTDCPHCGASFTEQPT